VYYADESCSSNNALVPSLQLVGIIKRKDVRATTEKDKTHKVTDLTVENNDLNPLLGYAYPGADLV